MRLCLEVILITQFFCLALLAMCVQLCVHVCLCIFMYCCVCVHVLVPHWACAIRNLLINQQLWPGAGAGGRERDREANKETDREREDQSRGL